MTDRQSPTKENVRKLQRQVSKALKEPGVAEAMDVYEKAESVYSLISQPVEPEQAAATSTTER